MTNRQPISRQIKVIAAVEAILRAKEGDELPTRPESRFKRGVSPQTHTNSYIAIWTTPSTVNRPLNLKGKKSEQNNVLSFRK
jgi:hypothetical protein